MKELFPETFSEGKIEFEVLKQILGGVVDEKEEKYGLNWFGKRRARQIALTPSTGTLRPCPEESMNWDTTQNLMIEGDNLEVLKLLQKRYSGKVKMIYIDPPYNTGGDFIYPDNYQDSIKNYLELTGQTDGTGMVSTNTESSGRFHTHWLNMMYPRLKLARELLRQDGAIFISIGDGELNNLLSSMDEIFGEDNLIGVIARVSKKTSNKGQHLAPSKDHLVVYAKNSKVLPPFMDVISESYTERFDQEDEKGKYGVVGLYQAALDPRPNQRYWIECPDGSYAIPPGNVFPDVIKDGASVVPQSFSDRVWRWSAESYLSKKDLIIFKKTPRSPLVTPSREQSIWNVYTKYYLEDRLRDGTRPRDFLDDITNDQGTSDLKQLGLNDIFTFPKPVELVKRILTWLNVKEGICLDFFAGSGTTAHAVMDLNKEDNGTRKFILVQLPEPCLPGSAPKNAGFNTISDITKERLRRAASKIKEENPDYLGDLGFRVFKLDSSNIRPWDPNPPDIQDALRKHIENLKPDRSERDILFELLLKLGLPLTVPIEEKSIAGKVVYSVGSGALFVCLAEKIESHEVESLTLGIVHWKSELSPKVEVQIVFRDSAFSNDTVKTNLTSILEQNGFARNNVRSL